MILGTDPASFAGLREAPTTAIVVADSRISCGERLMVAFQATRSAPASALMVVVGKAQELRGSRVAAADIRRLARVPRRPARPTEPDTARGTVRRVAPSGGERIVVVPFEPTRASYR